MIQWEYLSVPFYTTGEEFNRLGREGWELVCGFFSGSHGVYWLKRPVEKVKELKKMTRRGKFIVFEGIDGSGKSTQSKLVAKAIGAAHFEDGKSVTAEDRRTKPPIEILEMYCEGRKWLSDRIDEVVKTGQHAVCDRWEPSTRAYQRAAGISEEVISGTIYWASIANIKPDLIFWLNVPIFESQERLARRKGEEADPYENEGLLRAVKNNYCRIFAANPDVWDIHTFGKSVEETTQEILSVLRSQGIDIQKDPS